MTADPTAIEASPELRISFPQQVDRFCDAIVGALGTVCSQASARGLALDAVRLIAIVVDMHAAALEWQQALGYAESGVTETSRGLVGGKTLTWTSRSDGRSACAVILLDAQVLPDLVECTPWAVALLIHELAHVHERSMWRSPDPRPNCQTADIPAIRETFASMLWEEYFAERFAAPWLGEDDFDLDSWVPLIQEKHERVHALRVHFYRDRDVVRFWNNAVTQLGDAAQAIGRAMGRFADKPHALSELIEGLVFSTGWQEFASAAAGALNRHYLAALGGQAPDISDLAALIHRLWEEHGVRWDENARGSCGIWIADSNGVWRR